MSRRLAPLVPYVAVLVGLLVLANAWIAILVYHVGILLVVRRDGWDRLWRGWSAAVCVFGAVVCSGGGALVYLLWPYVHRPEVQMDTALTGLGLGGVKWWLFVAYFATVHPVLEEMLWRGRLLSTRRTIDPLDLLFAGYHVVPLSFFLNLTWIVVTVLLLAVTGWMWRLAALRWRGLGVPLCTHAVADLGVVLAAAVIRTQTVA